MLSCREAVNLSWSRYGGIALKKKILSRTAKLFVLGCLTQGTQRGFYLNGGGVDVSNLRIPGILQRIAFAYCVVALMKIWLPVRMKRGWVRPADEQDADVSISHWHSLFSRYVLHWVVSSSTTVGTRRLVQWRLSNGLLKW
jgi:hypothetical protein